MVKSTVSMYKYKHAQLTPLTIENVYQHIGYIIMGKFCEIIIHWQESLLYTIYFIIILDALELKTVPNYHKVCGEYIMPTLTYMTKTYTTTVDHGDIYTMTTTVKSYSNINTQ